MEFKEKLRFLRASRERKGLAARAEEARQKTAQQKQLEEDQIALNRLVEFTEEQLVPLLEAVNSEYLNGEGKITLSPKETKYDEDRKVEPHVSLELDWVYAGSPSWLRQELTMTISSNDIRLKGGDYNDETPLSKMEFRLDDEDWEKKLEDGILKYLSTPDACKSHVSVGGKPREDN